jgi:hypothetical protein
MTSYLARMKSMTAVIFGPGVGKEEVIVGLCECWCVCLLSRSMLCCCCGFFLNRVSNFPKEENSEDRSPSHRKI